MSFIQDFFSSLAERFYKENDLSDVIFTLSNASDDFRNYFISFFFKDIDFSLPITIHREYSRGNSRPDFVFQVGTEYYLLEIKIYDQNHHFKQYVTDFPDIKKRAYITNYTLSTENEKECKDCNYIFKTWKDMIDDLDKNQKEDEVFSAFLKYLRKVCGHKEIKKMENLSSLKSLFYFNNLVEEIIKEVPFKGYELSVYDGKARYSNGWSGAYFCLHKPSENKSIYPWLGIHYHNDEVYISLDFEFKPGWCDKIQNINIDMGSLPDCVTKDPSNDLLKIALKESKFLAFEKSEKDEQKNILVDFFKSVIEQVILDF